MKLIIERVLLCAFPVTVFQKNIQATNKYGNIKGTAEQTFQLSTVKEVSIGRTSSVNEMQKRY